MSHTVCNISAFCPSAKEAWEEARKDNAVGSAQRKELALAVAELKADNAKHSKTIKEITEKNKALEERVIAPVKDASRGSRARMPCAHHARSMQGRSRGVMLVGKSLTSLFLHICHTRESPEDGHRDLSEGHSASVKHASYKQQGWEGVAQGTARAGEAQGMWV